MYIAEWMVEYSTWICVYMKLEFLILCVFFDGDMWILFNFICHVKKFYCSKKKKK